MEESFTAEDVIERKLDGFVTYMQEIFNWDRSKTLTYILKKCNV